MSLVLKESEEQLLLKRIETLLRRLADEWDPQEGGEQSKTQSVAKDRMKEASDLAWELSRFVVR